MAFIDHGISPPLTGAPELGARQDLRRQIARLEREMAQLMAATYPRIELGAIARAGASAPAAPRLLGLGDLERARDDLATRLTAMRSAAAGQARRQAAAQDELERMLADPPGHRGRRLANADLGLPGCTTYEVRPRVGLLGMLAGWWHVKVSSGCPLPRVHRSSVDDSLSSALANGHGGEAPRESVDSGLALGA